MSTARVASELPPAAWVAALAGLPAMGPARLQALLRRWSPGEAWQRVRDGTAHRDPAVLEEAHRLDDVVAARWQRAAAAFDVAARWAAHEATGTTVLARGHPAFPPALADDPDPPAALFHRGSLAALDRPRVAVVGTRRCTWSGRSVAHDLGADLAAAGVCVLSGLALGIDGAAHEGALDGGAKAAAPVAVVATGLDVVYPRRHAGLWARVAARGAVISEYPLGTPPERWRFPARNRLIAALADVVVVVESHAAGGSLHTVEAALARGRTVMAVPGPVRSPAAAGTNGLLAAGSAPARDAEDVLVALGLLGEAAGRGPRPSAPGDPSGAPGGPVGAAVLEAVGWQPTSLGQIAERLDPALGVSLGALAVHLGQLERDGWLVSSRGWYERGRGP